MIYLFESEPLRFRKFEIADAKRLYDNHLEEEIKHWMTCIFQRLRIDAF